jgi:mannose-6-phosphate isomerase-like protein (cupin superfamily)
VTYNRRDLSLLLPGLIGSMSFAQDTKPSNQGASEPPEMTSKTYPFEGLPVRTNANGMKSRAVFNGITTRGQHLTMHISELGPGQEPHPPARQPHEEVYIIREGTLEVTLNGVTSRLGPGSVFFSAYNNLAGWRNVGTTTAQYYVISLEQHS